MLDELSRLEKTFDLVNKESNAIDLLLEIFWNQGQFLHHQRSGENVLTVVELYEIKTLLLR